MKHNYFFIAVIACFISASAFAQTVNKSCRDGQVYLKLKDQAEFSLPEYDEKHQSVYPEIFSMLINQFEIYKIQKAFPHIKSTQFDHTYRISFRQQVRVEELINALQKIGVVEYAEKVSLHRTCLTPNDALLANQYALGKINAYNAWNLHTGTNAVKIAIVDDEVRLDHADLSANRWINPGEIAGNGIDDDNNGYNDDVNGFDVADFDGDPSPPPTATNSFQTHGTHCAGIADAVSNNATGIASIGYGLSLMGVKCNPDTITNTTVIYYAMEGVEYAISAQADVISMSWGGDNYSQTEQNLFNYGYSQGITFVAAAGNDATGDIFFPSGYNHIISVGSTTNMDVKSSFSNFGAWVSVFAPGSNIYSTLAGSNTSYGNQSGTSMACPMVAGLCGLMKSYNPLMTPLQIATCLASTCDNIDAQNPGFVGQLGGGRVNALAALQCVDASANPVAHFSIINPISCNGLVSFIDESDFHPGQWMWYFGDGDSSALQNPTHQYRASNTYTVTLVAINPNGSSTEIQTNVISVSLPAAPTAADSSRCGSGSVSLSASGADTLRWYNVEAGGNRIATGAVFNTPVLSNTTTYYVQSEVPTPLQYAAEPDSALGGGGMFSGNNYHDLIFDAYAPFRLVSVKVYSNAEEDRTITLTKNGNVIASTTVTIPIGMSRVTLNFNVPAGTDFELGCGDITDLYRNNSGVSFPYTIPGLLKLTGTNAGTAFYYYFYDWEIQGPPCVSPRVAVNANILSAPVASFTSSVIANDGNYTDASTGAISWTWDFGDPASGVNNISSQIAPEHIFSSAGDFNVCLTVGSVNGCTDRHCDTTHATTLVGISNVSPVDNISVFPNPVKNILSLDFNSVSAGKKWSIRLTDVLGKTVAEKIINHVPASGKYDWELSSIVSGVYLLQLQNGDQTLIKKIIKE